MGGASGIGPMGIGGATGGIGPASGGMGGATAGGAGGSAPNTPSGGEGYPEHRGAGCDVTAGEYGTDNPNLPNPFQMNDGTIISSMAEWDCRRAEIIKDLEEYEVSPSLFSTTKTHWTQNLQHGNYDGVFLRLV
jgi:hypothetical protein